MSQIPHIDAKSEDWMMWHYIIGVTYAFGAAYDEKIIK
jgi:hypothetical protein